MKERLKLFFHCLLRVHQSYELVGPGGEVLGRGCWECDPPAGKRYRMRTFG